MGKERQTPCYRLVLLLAFMSGHLLLGALSEVAEVAGAVVLFVHTQAIIPDFICCNCTNEVDNCSRPQCTSNISCCDPGYVFSTDDNKCVDDNECQCHQRSTSESTQRSTQLNQICAGFQHTECKNSIGSYTCACKKGYRRDVTKYGFKCSARNTWGPAHCPQGYSPRVLNLTCGPNAEMATNVTCTLVPCPHPSQYAARTIAGHASAMPVGAAHSQQVFIVGDRATLFCPKSTPQLYLGVTVRPAIFSALIVCSHHLIQGKVRSIWLPVNSSPYQFDDGIPGTPSSNYTAPRYPVCDDHCRYTVSIANGRLEATRVGSKLNVTCDSGYIVIFNGTDMVCKNKHGFATFDLLPSGKLPFRCELLNPCVHANTCPPTSTCINGPGRVICNCSAGFRYNASTQTCDDIDECANGVCTQFATCTNSLGSYNCSCNQHYEGSGFINCNAIDYCQEDVCPLGTVCLQVPGIGFNCSDVNECESSANNSCSAHARCHNSFGNYSCQCLDAFSGDGYNCVNIDECSTGVHGCGTNSRCVDSPGSFRCPCAAGFSGSHGQCTDVDECTQALPLSPCIAPQSCRNTIGSFACDCPFGFRKNKTSGCVNVNECTPANASSPSPCSQLCADTQGSYQCYCTGGYRLDSDNTTCNDVDECNSLDSPPCDSNATCYNTIGDYTCTCNPGYSGNGIACVDVDECNGFEPHPCDPNALCRNTIGDYTCTCNSGYSGNGIACGEVDECSNASLHGCSPNASCSNYPGSHGCLCLNGFTGNGTFCEDEDECSSDLSNTCTQFNALCTNFYGSFTCSCPAGYSRIHSSDNCTNVNECVQGTHTCRSGAVQCMDTVGSFTCHCPTGYSGDSCLDINECPTAVCSEFAACQNSIGSYSCSCNPGYSGSGVTCTDIDECASNSTCHQLANCQNLPGSVRCTCPSGFSGNGVDDCFDIDECQLLTRKCQENSTCNNTIGDFVCPCLTGYERVGKACVDVDECELGDTNTCAIEGGRCQNTNGSFICSCHSGYTGNGFSCSDIDECNLATSPCLKGRRCDNTPGKFVCLDNATSIAQTPNGRAARKETSWVYILIGGLGGLLLMVFVGLLINRRQKQTPAVQAVALPGKLPLMSLASSSSQVSIASQSSTFGRRGAGDPSPVGTTMSSQDNTQQMLVYAQPTKGKQVTPRKPCAHQVPGDLESFTPRSNASLMNTETSQQYAKVSKTPVSVTLPPTLNSMYSLTDAAGYDDFEADASTGTSKGEQNPYSNNKLFGALPILDRLGNGASFKVESPQHGSKVPETSTCSEPSGAVTPVYSLCRVKTGTGKPYGGTGNTFPSDNGSVKVVPGALYQAVSKPGSVTRRQAPRFAATCIQSSDKVVAGKKNRGCNDGGYSVPYTVHAHAVCFGFQQTPDQHQTKE